MNFDFPGLLNRTYLNTASFGLMSQCLVNWQKEQDKLLMQNGSDFRIQFPDFMSEVKQVLARFFENSVEYTFLLPNFSFGFNALLDGFSKSERFLMVEDDYPSIHYPIISRGFAISLAKADTHLEENLWQEIISKSPSILALSLVQYTDGLKVDLEFLKTLKKEFPDLLIIADDTQFCGTAAFNFENSGIDPDSQRLQVDVCGFWQWFFTNQRNYRP